VRKPLLPPVYFTGAILAMLALHFLAPGGRFLSYPWTLAGLAPMAAGIAMALAGDRAFKRHGTTIKPFEVSSALVTDGLYRYSRNPIYLGMEVLLIGLALLLGSLTPLSMCVALSVLLHYRFVLIEERMLAEKFGAEWEAYRARVRRWV